MRAKTLSHCSKLKMISWLRLIQEVQRNESGFRSNVWALRYFQGIWWILWCFYKSLSLELKMLSLWYQAVFLVSVNRQQEHTNETTESKCKVSVNKYIVDWNMRENWWRVFEAEFNINMLSGTENDISDTCEYMCIHLYKDLLVLFLRTTLKMYFIFWYIIMVPIIIHLYYYIYIILYIIHSNPRRRWSYQHFFFLKYRSYYSKTKRAQDQPTVVPCRSFKHFISFVQLWLLAGWLILCLRSIFYCHVRFFHPIRVCVIFRKGFPSLSTSQSGSQTKRCYWWLCPAI